MNTHAYVRYEDDKRFAIVEVDDIKGFNPEDDFEGTFYSTKWTDDSGASDYYRSRILLVAGEWVLLKCYSLFAIPIVSTAFKVDF